MTTTATSICPDLDWCVSNYPPPHVHLQQETPVIDVDGRHCEVFATYNERSDSHHVVVDGFEFDQDSGAELIRAVSKALNLPLQAVAS